VFTASQERGAQAVSSGLGEMIDSMSPGTTIVAGLESYPGVQLSVTLSGTTVAATFGKTTATTQVRWELPRATLSSGVEYSFTLTGRVVLVEKARSG
jgi:hypothetical protein